MAYAFCCSSHRGRKFFGTFEISSTSELTSSSKPTSQRITSNERKENKTVLSEGFWILASRDVSMFKRNGVSDSFSGFPNVERGINFIMSACHPEN